MNVDELLENNVITPSFSCVVIKPNKDRLCLIDNGNIKFLYAKSDVSYPIKKENITEYLNATGCARTDLYETNNIKILKEFIKLAESSQLKDGKRIIPVGKIMNACYNLGFPFVQMPTLENKGTLLGFDLNRFVERLENLCICYAIWKAIQVNDYDLLKQIKKAPVDLNEMQLEIERRLIAVISINIIYEKGIPTLKYHANDLMSLAEAQLAVLISKGANYLGGGCIAYCSDCGQKFVKYRSNSTLCEKCKGNTGKSRSYRAKKKGEHKNG